MMGSESAEQAKKRQGKRNDLNIPKNSPESSDQPKASKSDNETRVIVSTLAGVSHNTMSRVEFVLGEFFPTRWGIFTQFVVPGTHKEMTLAVFC